jgi:hypothetical protein
MIIKIFGYVVAAGLVSLIPSATRATPIDISAEKPESLSRHIPSATVFEFDECERGVCLERIPHGHKFERLAERWCDPPGEDWPPLRHRPSRAHRHRSAKTADCGLEDPDHSVTFMGDSDPTATLSGTEFIGPTDLVGEGDRGPKIDNIAFGDPPAPIPEPDTLMLLGSLFYFISLVRIRRERPQALQAVKSAQ